MKAFWRSFGYARDGIAYAWRTQRNFRIHAWIALAVLLALPFLHVSGLGAAIVALVIAFVLVIELLNTALEALVDLVSPQVHPLARAAKDAAAGAVLIAAAGAVATGLLVFLTTR